jgi:MFS transporter, DHA3 family, tetracycline resistance protein
MRHRVSNRSATLFIALRGTTSTCSALVYTVEVIYQIERVGLNPFQLLLAGTVLRLMSLIFQAPTGVLADLFGRRWAIAGGLLLMGSGFTLEGAIPTFVVVLAAQVLWGFGATLMDGADVAWIADEVSTEETGPLYLHATQIGWLCTLPGIAGSVTLATFHLNLPLLVGGTLYAALGLAVALVLPERRLPVATSEAGGIGGTWRQMRATIRTSARLIHRRTVLLLLLLAGVLEGVSYAGFGQLWQYHLLHAFTFPALGSFKPIVWFGIIEAVIALSSVVGIAITRRYVHASRSHSAGLALLVVDGIQAFSIIGFALSRNFGLALAALWLVTAAGGPSTPLEQAWMNHYLDSEVRATVFSIQSQIGALASIIGGPLLGILATSTRPQTTLVVSGLLLLPALLLYAQALSHDHSQGIPPSDRA